MAHPKQNEVRGDLTALALGMFAALMLIAALIVVPAAVSVVHSLNHSAALIASAGAAK